MKMELIEGSETSAIRTQTQGNYPKENILHKFRISSDENSNLVQCIGSWGGCGLQDCWLLSLRQCLSCQCLSCGGIRPAFSYGL